MKHILAILPLIVLSACTAKSTDNSNAEGFEPDAVISINMTYDRDIELQVNKIAVVPNNVAPWAGSLFVVDDNNALYRGDIDRGDFKRVVNNVKDLAPLARENAAGILFATPLEANDVSYIMPDNAKIEKVFDLTKIQKNLKKSIIALQEINDEGDYIPIDFVLNGPEKIKSLCSTNSPHADKVFSLSEAGTIQTLSVNVNTDDITLSSETIGQQDKNLDDCHIYHDGKPSIINTPPNALQTHSLDAKRLLFTTEESKSSPRLFVQNGDETTAINIIGGLTTTAPTRIDSFYVTPNSLGGVLRDGAIIIADNESGRLIYISLEFFKQRISEIAVKQEDSP